MPKIVTLTMNPSVDLACDVDQVSPDIKLRTSQPSREPGGGGLNVSRAISRLGGKSQALWAHGGATGRMLAELLDAENLDHQPLEVQGLTRENFTIFESNSDRQYRFVVPGPQLTDREVHQCLTAVENLRPQPDYLVLSGSLPPGADDDFYAKLITAAPEKTRVVVDTTKEPLKLAVDAGVFLIKPNVRELEHLMGEKIQHDEQISDYAEQLVQEGKCEIVVVSLGAGGAILTTAEGTEFLRSPTVPVKSKIGAGDSMVGGIVLSLSQGNNIKTAILYGIAAGAAAVMTPGSQLCRQDDTERLFENMQSQQNKAS